MPSSNRICVRAIPGHVERKIIIARSCVELEFTLGSGLIDQSQKATAAAMQIADK
jgi:hypothetical protein